MLRALVYSEDSCTSISNAASSSSLPLAYPPLTPPPQSRRCDHPSPSSPNTTLPSPSLPSPTVPPLSPHPPLPPPPPTPPPLPPPLPSTPPSHPPLALPAHTNPNPPPDTLPLPTPYAHKRSKRRGWRASPCAWWRRWRTLSWWACMEVGGCGMGFGRNIRRRRWRCWGGLGAWRRGGRGRW